jgi:hypothetical protein
MIKAASVLALVLLAVLVAGSVHAAGPSPLNSDALAAILGEPAFSGACPTPRGSITFAASRSGLGAFGGAATKSACSATATCVSGTVSCQGNSSCSAQDANCALLQSGGVTCDGVFTPCPACCPYPPMSRDFACCSCEMTGSCNACCRCETGLSFQACAVICTGG